MQQENRRHSYFELAVILLLVVIASWPAFSISIAGLMPLLHGTFLVISYLLLRLVTKRLSKWAGTLVFALSAFLLLADIAVRWATGLHLNGFVVSVMFQPGIAEELGFSTPLILFAISVFLLGCMLLARRLHTPSFVLKGRFLAFAALLSGLGAQLVYGGQFYRGSADIEETKLGTPFFTTLHSYYILKAFDLIAERGGDNPFSAVRVEQVNQSAPEDRFGIKTPTNILFIVIDSLRSKDISANPALAPNLVRWAKQGTLKLDQYSVSNCTHFSMYSMFTGKLSTQFGVARRDPYSYGLLPALEKAGYSLSTTEAASLDWYNTARIIFPESTERYISEQPGARAQDADVTARTIAKLDAYRKAKTPFFHLAYYFGPHFPYDNSFGSVNDSPYEKYQHTISAVDGELGKLLDWASESGALDNTMVIITADHGEEFGNTGMSGHATRLSDEQVVVPLLISPPKGASLPAMPNSHLELVPFLKAYLGGTPHTFSPGPIILANCGYDYPRGFAVLDGKVRADFSYTGGYLTPTYSPYGQMATKPEQLAAAQEIIKAIKKGALQRPK